MEKNYSVILSDGNILKYDVVKRLDQRAVILSDNKYLYYVPYRSNYSLKFKSKEVLEDFLNQKLLINDDRFILYYVQKENIDPDTFELDLLNYLKRLRLKLKIDDLEFDYNENKFNEITNTIISQNLNKDEELVFLLNIYLKEIIRKKIDGKWFFVKEYVLYPYYNPVILDSKNQQYDFIKNIQNLSEIDNLNYIYEKSIIWYEKGVIIPPNFDDYIKKHFNSTEKE